MWILLLCGAGLEILSKFILNVCSLSEAMGQGNMRLGVGALWVVPDLAVSWHRFLATPSLD